jgi:hypothetical protein
MCVYADAYLCFLSAKFFLKMCLDVSCSSKNFPDTTGSYSHFPIAKSIFYKALKFFPRASSSLFGSTVLYIITTYLLAALSSFQDSIQHR